MNRRNFLNQALVLSAGLVLPWRSLSLPPTHAIESTFVKFRQSDPYPMLDLYEAYASRVGMMNIGILNTLSAWAYDGIQEQLRIIKVLASFGYTDTTLISGHVVRHDTIEFFPLFRSPLEICVPFFDVSTYTIERKRPVLNSHGIIGMAVATAQYKYENPAVTVDDVAALFLPTAFHTNPGFAVKTSVSGTAAQYQTKNGLLKVSANPTRDTAEMVVTIEANGKKRFKQDYPYEIVGRKSP